MSLEIHYLSVRQVPQSLGWYREMASVPKASFLTPAIVLSTPFFWRLK